MWLGLKVKVCARMVSWTAIYQLHLPVLGREGHGVVPVGGALTDGTYSLEVVR